MNFGIESVAPLAAADVVLAGSGASALGCWHSQFDGAANVHKQIIIQLSSHLFHVLEDSDPYCNCIDTTIVGSRVSEENCVNRKWTTGL